MIPPVGDVPLEIPRAWLSTFEPARIAKYPRRLPGVDAHVIRLYARGMSVREIRRHGLKLYGWEGWPDLISTITDEVLAEVEQWQTRPLDRMYPIVDFDALRLQIRDEGRVKNKAVHLALGIGAGDC